MNRAIFNLQAVSYGPRFSSVTNTPRRFESVSYRHVILNVSVTITISTGANKLILLQDFIFGGRPAERPTQLLLLPPSSLGGPQLQRRKAAWSVDTNEISL